jgi:glycosyltransferase involved in cell wall biosynthesis
MSRIRLAIVSNSVTPYRINLHSRLTRDCTELKLWSLFTHEHSNAPWKLAVPPAIRPVYFGDGEASAEQGLLHRPLHEAGKGVRIAHWLKEHQIDAIILFGYNDACLLYVAWWAKRRHMPCYLFGDSNADCDAPSGIKGAVKRVALPRILGLFTGVMYCGSKGAEYFRRYGVPEPHLFPFPYEPAYEEFQNAPTTADGERRRLLYCGRLVAVKRVDLLISAFHRIAEQRPTWDLVIVGDGPLRAELMDRMAPHLTERIQFPGFINDPGSLAQCYANCDVLVLPSDCEPWGVVVTEAATRLALVCSSKVGAAADLIEDHVNGRVFPAGDGAALTSALLEVTHPNHIDAMKSASPRVLARWRNSHDPVAGLRLALQFAGLSKPSVTVPPAAS